MFSQLQSCKVRLVALCLMCTSIFAFSACKDKLVKAELTQALLSTEQVNIPAPIDRELSSVGTVKVEHLNGAELVISQVRLIEHDRLIEISIADLDDWEGTRLSEGQHKVMTLIWTPRDAQPDRADLIISTNIGDLTASVQTADLDADLQVTVSGEWVSSELGVGGGRIQLNGTVPGSRGEALVTLTSVGLEPLKISILCLTKTGEACLPSGEIGSDQFPFMLCASVLDNGCAPLTWPDELSRGDDLIVSLRYFPPQRNIESATAQLLIVSNSASTPRVVIDLRATPCILGVNAEACNLEICGDGVLQTDEECDDGNDDDEDACLSTCRLNVCGDGIFDRTEEECDDGNPDQNDGCTVACKAARCGDGFLFEGVEECDDGDEDNGDRCLVGCRLASCGDGFIWEGIEECDDGNRDDQDDCSNDCRFAGCGDGIVQSGEECDLGSRNGEICRYGRMSCQGCTIDCENITLTGEYCGDGIVNGPETCDQGDQRQTECLYGGGSCRLCSADCIEFEAEGTYCGDGEINGPEECDGQEGCEELCTLSASAPPCAPSCPTLDWRFLSALSFEMGYASGSPQEAPVHAATVAPFLMTRSEITIDQYASCVQAGVCSPPRDRNDSRSCNWGAADRRQHPINCITWSDARSFARWVGGDLPSETQWERAARGANGTGLYPWSTDSSVTEPTCEQAVIGGAVGECGINGTSVVCSSPMGDSPDGLCDLIGNVWEWTLDIYLPYDGSAHDDSPRCMSPDCEDSEGYRTLRGGGWTAYASGWRATMREGYPAGNALNFFGFRVVKAP